MNCSRRARKKGLSQLAATIAAVCLSWAYSTNVAAQAPKATEPKTTASKTTDAAEDKTTRDASETGEAVAKTIPQVPGIRDGTLGLPASGSTKGLQTAIHSSIVGEGNTEAFAKLGKLEVTRRFAVEFLGESYTSTIPKTVIGDSHPLPEMTATDLASVGFRLRYHFRNRRWTVTTAKPEGNDCEVRVNEYSEENDDGPLTPTVEKKPKQKQESKSERVGECKDNGKVADARLKAQIATKSSGLTLSGGLRILKRRSDESDGVDSNGIAGELSVQYNRTSEPVDPKDNWGLNMFASVSGFQLERAEDKVANTDVIFPEIRVFRLTAGAEIQALVNIKDKPLLPRIGFYATFARNWWTNEFTTGGMNPDISGTELQGAIYMSGDFLGGFSGMVSFGALKPYGRDEPWQYFVNLIPSVGAPIGDDGGSE